MADFKVIETQEELNAIIGKIRKEATERAESKYADYEKLKKANADLTEKLVAAENAATDTAAKYRDYDQNINSLQSKVKQYELDKIRIKVALASGLPYEAAGRLQGETEEEIKADAELFAGLMKPNRSQPLADTETGTQDPKRAALRAVLNGIKED